MMGESPTRPHLFACVPPVEVPAARFPARSRATTPTVPYLCASGGSISATGTGGGIAINFDEHEARRIVGLLHDIEASDAQLQQAQAGVEQRGGFESLDAIRLHMDMNVDDEHDREIGQTRPKLKPRLQF